MKRALIEIQSSDRKHRHLCVDEENAREIMAFLQTDPRYAEKFRYNVDIILNHQPTKDIFEKEKISKPLTMCMQLSSSKEAKISAFTANATI